LFGAASAMLASCGGSSGRNAEGGASSTSGNASSVGGGASSTNGSASSTGGNASSSAGEATASSTSGGAIVVMDEGQATDLLLGALCSKVIGCCDAEELEAYFSGFSEIPSDEATCVDLRYSSVFFTFFDFMDPETSAGRWVFHPELVADCANALRAASCTEWFHRSDLLMNVLLHPACENMVEPLVADNEPCSRNEECVSGDCSSLLDTCLPTAALGEPCGSDAPVYTCRYGLYCVDGVCAPRLHDGEACLSDGWCRSRRCNEVCYDGCEGP